MGNKLALAAVVLALAALLLQVLGRGGERAAGAAPSGLAEIGPLSARVATLEDECAALRRALDGVRILPVAAPEREPAGAEPDPRLDELAGLERRLAGLERQLVDSRSTAESADARAQLVLRAFGGGPEVEEATRRARDVARAEGERLEALRQLRGTRLSDGTDARLPVLAEMIELARTSQKGETRADVWRQLSHVTDRRLLRPLLNALAYDEYAKAREEAAEALEDFLPDALVEAALRAATENDPDPGVRRQAAESLAGGR